jgi:four helix bundle protein
MNDETFENLEVWQDAVELATTVYGFLQGSRDFAFRDQMQRAALSISNNIAEGYERVLSKRIKRLIDARRENFA